MNILIVTSAKFPEGDAESVRLHAIGRLFRKLGHSVTYVGMGYSNYLQKLEYDRFPYISLRKGNDTKISKLFDFVTYNQRLEKYILSHNEKGKIDAILFADLLPSTINMLKTIRKNRNIQLIADSVEWYSPEQFKLGLLSPAMILKNIENRYAINKSINIITISNYLYTHFTKSGCTCVRIPVILDVKNTPCKKNLDLDTISILYAGSPGKKDYVDEMLRGILLLNEKEVVKLKFELAGVSFNDIKNLFTSDELMKLNKSVNFLGRVKRRIVLEKLSKADFTVLLRSPDQRYAKAGFPTKVVESLATATPVILNLTSDLGEYIHHEQEGLIVSECSALAFSETLKQALELNIIQRENMRLNARACAEKYFDYRIYIDQVRTLIS